MSLMDECNFPSEKKAECAACGTKTQGPRACYLYPRGRIVRAINAAGSAFTRWCTACDSGADPDDSEVAALAAAHDALEVTAHHVSTECRRAQWYGFVAREAPGRCESTPRASGLWAFARRVQGQDAKGRTNGLREIKSIMREHFAGLAADPNPLASSDWDELPALVVAHCTPQGPHSEGHSLV